tara:strand:- start:409 stop:672 length:264 start_codon:yes stop_codon:yes gene_type:complete
MLNPSLKIKDTLGSASTNKILDVWDTLFIALWGGVGYTAIALLKGGKAHQLGILKNRRPLSIKTRNRFIRRLSILCFGQTKHNLTLT